MQKFLEATGENRDAAVENALKQLGLERDDVSVEVLEIGKKGFLGIGATPARVRVTYEAPDIPAAKPEVKREERKPAPKAEPKQEKPAVKAEKPAPKQEKTAEKPQKLSITTDDNTPRLVKAAPADFVPEKLEFERPPRRDRSDRPRRDRGDRNGRDRRPRRPREDRPITPSVPKERELIPVSEAGMQQAEKLARGSLPVVVMMHYPPLYKDLLSTPFTEILERYGARTVVFGHLHGAGIRVGLEGLVRGIEYHLVSCDALHFSLRRIDESVFSPKNEI